MKYEYGTFALDYFHIDAFKILPIRRPAVRPIRLLPRRQDGDGQERLRGVVSARLRHQGGVSLPGARQSGLQPSEERQGPVPDHLPGEDRPAGPAEARIRPGALQPGPVQPGPRGPAERETLVGLPHPVERRG